MIFLNAAILKNALFLPTLNTALQSIVQSLSHTPPTLWAQAVIGWIRVWCRHRSERPFISSLGRWTPHLISNKGNFSILQPIYSDSASDLGFYYFSWPAKFSWYLKDSSSFLLDDLSFSLSTFSPCRDRETLAKSFEFQQRKLVGLCSFFGSVEFLCWSEKHGSAIVQDSWKGWNRDWKTRRGCCFTHQDQRTGKLYFNAQLLSSFGEKSALFGRGCALRAQSVRKRGKIE